LSGLILNLLLTRPAPIVLMAIGIFYLWEYFAKTRKNSALSPQGPNSFSPFRAINLPAQSIPSAMIAGDEK